ncbi:MAG: DUF885 domain-containing protein [Candidatus Brocadiae bacterium]|nr:DUF885 domain-containing protein [Candidatus Brocadiia bacterium]
MKKSSKLHKLLQKIWDQDMQEYPTYATRCGEHQYNDRLSSMSLQDIARRYKNKQKFLQNLKNLDQDQMSQEDQIYYETMKRLLEDEIHENAFQAYLMPVTARQGFHSSFPHLPDLVPLHTVKDYENYIARLNAFKVYTEQYIALMREGIQKGLVVPRLTLEGCEHTIRCQLVEDIKASRFYKPFLNFPKSFSSKDCRGLEKAGRKSIEESIFPSYRIFLKFMQEEYLPASRESISLSALPQGKEYYAFLVKHHTTLDITPEEVHKIGLNEVERIHKEMEEIIKKLKFTGSFAEFLNFLRNDSRFYAQSPKQLLQEASYLLKKMDGELPRFFKTLPRTPYGIKEVPDYIAPQTTTGYYEPPSGDGSKAGFYYVNTYNLKSRPLYELECLSFHETVPGHHLQLALQMELTDMPQFRRFSHFSAFLEGWALYSERLSKEMGFYTDLYSDFGRLTYEMYRACRLVVDTGMHCMNWPRQKAIDFMLSNTALSEHNIVTEVDRYISTPAQALAYKIGEIKIKELRSYAETELGKLFDLREFHDEVLRHGALPLPILENNIKTYVSKKKQA